MNNIILQWSMLLLYLTALDGFGQQKRFLTEADHARWYNLYQTVLSDDGLWLSYCIKNPQGTDTLVLRETAGAHRRMILGGVQGSFSPNSERHAFLKDNLLHIRHLASGGQDTIPEVTQYSFSKDSRFIIAEGPKDSKTLRIIHLDRMKAHSLEGIHSYLPSQDGTKIAMVLNKDGVAVLNYIHMERPERVHEILKTVNKISNLEWNAESDAIAYLEELPAASGSAPGYLLHCSTLRTGNKPKVSDQVYHDKNSKAVRLPSSRLFFSADGARLFFDANAVSEIDPEPANPNLWSSNANVLPPRDRDMWPNSHLMSWNLKDNRSMPVTDDVYPLGLPTARGDHALIIDNSPYQPYFKYGGKYADLYIRNLKTGDMKKISQRISDQKDHIVLSPGGGYITWFAGGHWQLYDVGSEKSRCLTCGIDANFEDLQHDYPGEKFPNSKPYWTKGDEHVLLADTNDIWMLTPDGRSKRRLTDGKPSSSMFRLYDERSHGGPRNHYLLHSTGSLDLQKGLLIKETVLENLYEGFGIYRKGATFERLLLADDKIASVVHKGKAFLYTQSDFDKSPELAVLLEGRKEPKVLQRTNAQQKEYHWGRSALVHYKVDGIPLKAALFYPADYDPKKSYPMIVQVYQRLSRELRTYVPPSSTTAIGFNVTCLTSAGYFVLCPDIRYTLNQTGASALRCVNAAVEKAVSTASIDSLSIGLFGHSFGGFEVSYIMTQTDRYKTAVSGAGWHDLVATYLGTDDYKVSSMWRFDTQQLRITAPYHSPEFLANSPIINASGIKNPILLWAGKKDTRINWENSSKMQMALWRLGKQSTLLAYPEEQHFMTDAKNKIDLSKKTMEWYDYHLKSGKKPDWVE